MDEYIEKIIPIVESVKTGWNFNADEYNQWDDLSFDEQHELVTEAIKEGL